MATVAASWFFRTRPRCCVRRTSCSPTKVTTPARRIYFPVMMMYLDEAAAERQYEEFATRLTEFMGVVRNPDVLSDCIAISKHVMAREYYKALMLSRKLDRIRRSEVGACLLGPISRRRRGPKIRVRWNTVCSVR
jgi:flagellar biosynthesis regulator FlbT